jgi:hypothetical protein
MLPKVLRIVGKNYAVETMELGEDYGECNDQTQTIKIAKNIAHGMERDTLIHEAIHAIDYCMQLRMSEKQVCGLGTAIYALLADNPDLVKYIMEKPKKYTANPVKTAVAAKKRPTTRRK